MSANDNIIRFMHYQDGFWTKGNASSQHFDSKHLEEEMLKLYPYCTFKDIIQEAEKEKHNIELDLNNNTIELIESNNKKPISDLVDKDFCMLFCYSPKQKSVLLHKQCDLKITSSMTENIKKCLIPDFNEPKEQGIYTIYRKEDSKLCFERKNFREISSQIKISFNSIDILKKDEQLRNYKSLFDISPCFKDITIDILIDRIVRLFKDEWESDNLLKVPCLSISFDNIVYTNGKGSVKELNEFSRNMIDPIKEELKQFINDALKSEEVNNENSNEYPRDSSKYQNSSQATDIENHNEEDEATIPSKKKESDISNSGEVITRMLSNDKYYTHIKSDSKDRYKLFYLIFNEANHDPVNEELKESFNKPVYFDALIQKLSNTFILKEGKNILNELAEYLVQGQINVNFESCSEPSDMPVWEVHISGNIDKEKFEKEKRENETKKNSLDKREQELKVKEQEIIKRENTCNKKEECINKVKTILKIEDHIRIEDEIRKLQNHNAEINKELEELKLITNILDSDKNALKRKVEIITNCINQKYVNKEIVNKLSNYEFEEIINKFAESYTRLQNIYTLKEYNNEDLKEFTQLFGNVKKLVDNRVDKIIENLETLSNIAIIKDAIKILLADPEMRKKYIKNPEVINKELECYGLKIYIPQTGEPADPLRHKIVGYEVGGLRGTVSSIIRWGLEELDKDDLKGHCVYKAEINIFQ